jgi:hypothetical protein
MQMPNEKKTAVQKFETVFIRYALSSDSITDINEYNVTTILDTVVMRKAVSSPASIPTFQKNDLAA